jgi:hypothetical protein
MSPDPGLARGVQNWALRMRLRRAVVPAGFLVGSGPRRARGCLTPTRVASTSWPLCRSTDSVRARLGTSFWREARLWPTSAGDLSPAGLALCRAVAEQATVRGGHAIYVSQPAIYSSPV